MLLLAYVFNMLGWLYNIVQYKKKIGVNNKISPGSGLDVGPLSAPSDTPVLRDSFFCPSLCRFRIFSSSRPPQVVIYSALLASFGSQKRGHELMTFRYCAVIYFSKKLNVAVTALIHRDIGAASSKKKMNL